jgi:hypothetical protein
VGTDALRSGFQRGSSNDSDLEPQKAKTEPASRYFEIAMQGDIAAMSRAVDTFVIAPQGNIDRMWEPDDERYWSRCKCLMPFR